MVRGRKLTTYYITYNSDIIIIYPIGNVSDKAEFRLPGLIS